MQACIAIDWLQLHVQVRVRYFEETKSKYIIEKSNFQTRHFKSVFTVLDGDDVVATLVCDPHSEVGMQKDSGLLKIENKYLYQVDLKIFVVGLLADLDLGLRNITRLDIAQDFEKFACNLTPQTFIRGFMAGKYVKVNKAKFKTQGECSKLLKYESLKYGSEKSEVSYVLYNKTKEMEDVKIKGWIKDHWRSNGWDEEKQVWRLEFSLKSSTKAVINADTGEVYSMKDINTLDHVFEIYKYLLKQYFQFVKYDRTKERKDRMRKLNLFAKDMKCAHVRIQLSEKKDARRADKIFTKKLMELNSEMRGHDFELSIFTGELLSYYVVYRDLKEWFMKRYPGVPIGEKQLVQRAGDQITMMHQPKALEFFSQKQRPVNPVHNSFDVRRLAALKAQDNYNIKLEKEDFFQYIINQQANAASERKEN